MPTSMSSAEEMPGGRPIGIILMIGSVLAVLAMLHHPSVSSHNVVQEMEELRHEGALNRLVHGGMIALLGLWALAFSVVSTRLGSNRGPVRIAWLAYAAGIGVMIGAALLSGFVAPGIADRYAGAPGTELEMAHHLVVLTGIGNQVLAQCGVILMSIGIGGWSVALVTGRGAGKWVGLGGLLAGAIPAFGLMLGFIELDVAGMTTVVVLQTIWYVAVGWLLVRRTI